MQSYPTLKFREATEEILSKHFSSFSRERGNDLNTTITGDCRAMGVNTSKMLDDIIDLHIGEASYKDTIEMHQVAKQQGWNEHTAKERLFEAPKILRLVRKCFELHFGIKWERYRALYLEPSSLKSLPWYRKPKFAPLPSAYRPPEKLYIYMPAKIGLLVLQKKQLRCSSPLTFNDILDIQVPPELPDNVEHLARCIAEMRTTLIFDEQEACASPKNVTSFLHQVLRNTKSPTTTRTAFSARNEASYRKWAKQVVVLNKNLTDYWSEYARYFRVLCCTTSFQNVLMWAHYGNSHQGVVLGLRTHGLLSSSMPVKYSETPPPIASTEELVAEVMGTKKLDRIRRFADLASWKSSEWQYEQEWRTIFLRNDWCYDSLREIPVAELHDYFPIKDDELASIHFGVNIDCDLRKSIAEYATANLPHLELFQASRCADKRSIKFHNC